MHGLTIKIVFLSLCKCWQYKSISNHIKITFCHMLAVQVYLKSHKDNVLMLAVQVYLKSHKDNVLSNDFHLFNYLPIIMLFDEVQFQSLKTF